MNDMTKFQWLAVALLLVLAGCKPVAAAQVRQEEEPVDPQLAAMWFDMSMGANLVGIYNEYATPRDIARADHVSLTDLLDKVEVGRRLVVFKSAADVEALAPRLADEMDIIGYNLENGPANRPDEQADPLGSVRRVRAVADQYDMEVAFGPNRDIAMSHGPQVAPYVDIFVLQVQRAQTEPAVVRDFVVPLSTELHQVNPDLEISVQVRTEGDMQALLEMLGSMENSIDGISILTNDETAPVAEELLLGLRGNVTPTPTSAAPDPDTAQESEQPVAPLQNEPAQLPAETPTTSSRRTVQATPAAATQDTASDSAPVRSVLLLVGLGTMGILIAGVVTTVLLYSVRNMRGR